MLSHGEKLTEKARLRTLPLLEQPRTVRLKFKKVGNLQYTSHLDLQRTFIRVINRACIPVWYTKGFNPHAKLVFSTPLSVGAQSVYEFLDIRVDREMPCEEIMARLNGELTDELCIMDAYIPTTDFSSIAWASYEIEIHTAGASAEMAQELEKTLTTSPLTLIKRTNSGEKEVDIVPMIQSVSVRFDGETGNLLLSAVLRAASSEFLNPEMLITGMKQKNGILGGNPAEEWYTIMRTSVMTEDGALFR